VTGYVIIYVLVALVVSVFVVAKLLGKKSERVKLCADWLQKKLMYNFFLRLMLQSDLKMLHMTIAYFSLERAFRKGGLSFLLALVLAAFLTLPFFIFVAVLHFRYMELFTEQRIQE